MIDSEMIVEATFNGKKAIDEMKKFNNEANALVKTFNKLGSSVEKIQEGAVNKIATDFRKLSNNIKDMNPALDKSKTSFESTAKSSSTLKNNIKGFNNEINKSNNALNRVKISSDKASSSFNNLSKKSKNSGVQFNSFTDKLAKLYIAFKALEGIGKFTVNVASDLNEVNNALSVIGSKGGQEAIDTINQVIDKQIELGALSEVQAKKTLASFLRILDASKIPQEKALEYGETLTQLSVDIASFYNISNEVAATKLTSGILGEIEPLRQLGIVLTEVTLKEVALRYGIIGTNQEMTEQEKVTARYLAILEQSSSAQGDFARTQTEFANQLRISQTETESLGSTIGFLLLPIANELVIAYRKLISAINDSLSSFEGTESIVNKIIPLFSTLSTVFGSISVIVKALADSFFSFLDALQLSSGEVDGFNDRVLSLTSGIEQVINVLSFFINTITRGVRFAVDTLVDFADILIKATNLDPKGIKETAKKIENSFKELKEGVQKEFEESLVIDTDKLRDELAESRKNIEKEYDKFLKELDENIESESPQKKKVKIQPSFSAEETIPISIKPVGLQEIKTNLVELRFEAEQVGAGVLSSVSSFSKYYAQYSEIQAKLINGQVELTDREKETLSIIEDTIPLVNKNLKAKGLELEALEKSEGYYKGIKDSVKEQIIANKQVLETINDSVIAIGNQYRGLEGITRPLDLQYQIIKNQNGAREQRNKIDSQIIESLYKEGDLSGIINNIENESVRANLQLLQGKKEQFDSVSALTEAEQNYLLYLQKQSLILGKFDTYYQASINSANELLNVTKESVSGEVSSQSITNFATSLAAFAGPIASTVTKTVGGLVSGIIDLAMAVAVAKTEKVISGIEKEIIRAEREAELIKIEVESLQKAVDDLKLANEVEDDKRDAQRAKLEASLIKQGKTELEIQEELRKFDEESAKLRLDQIEEEKKATEKSLRELEKQGYNVLNPDGSVNEEALQRARDAQKSQEKTLANLEAVSKEIQQLQDTAGKYITGNEEDEAEALAKKVQSIIGKDAFVSAFGNIPEKINFGQDDLRLLQTLLTQFEKGFDDDFLEANLDAIKELSKLDKEEAELQLEILKEQEDLINKENENLKKQKENIEDLFKLYEKTFDFGGSVTVARQLAFTATPDQLNRPSENINTIGTQINNNIVNQNYVNV